MTRIHPDTASDRLAYARARLSARVDARAPYHARPRSVNVRPVAAPVYTYTAEQIAATQRGLAEAVNAEQDARNARPGAWW